MELTDSREAVTGGSIEDPGGRARPDGEAHIVSPRTPRVGRQGEAPVPGGIYAGKPHLLLAAIRKFAATAEAVEDGVNEYGAFLRAEGALNGPNDRVLEVITIWFRPRAEEAIRFVTLKPMKAKRL
jgi:hypothetical protein